MIDTKGIQVQNEKAIDETVGVIKMIFTPINAMIALSSIRKYIWKSER